MKPGYYGIAEIHQACEEDMKIQCPKCGKWRAVVPGSRFGPCGCEKPPKKEKKEKKKYPIGTYAADYQRTGDEPV